MISCVVGPSSSQQEKEVSEMKCMLDYFTLNGGFSSSGRTDGHSTPFFSVPIDSLGYGKGKRKKGVKLSYYSICI